MVEAVDAMNEKEADAFLQDGMRRVRPLIDDLAVQIGESPEAWRGVATVVNGLSAIMFDLEQKNFDDNHKMVVMAVVIAAISEHPALIAAERFWNG